MKGKLSNENMEETIKLAMEYFKDKTTVESALLVSKDVMEDLNSSISGANIVALVMQTHMTERNKKLISSTGAREDGFLALRIIVEDKDFVRLMDILKSNKFSTVSTPNAKAIEDFLKQGSDGETIQ
jgi:type III secretory pathway lipoprotein EscJ